MENPAVRTCRDLEVWQKAIGLTAACYRQTATLPREETYGLAAQVRRAATSIAANIAEGHGRESTGAFMQCLRDSQGSLEELDPHRIVAERVGLASHQQANAVLDACDTLGRMPHRLIRSPLGHLET